MSITLAVDLGSTTFRAALVTADGEIAHLDAIPPAVQASATGWAECDPDLWWEALCHCANALAREAPDLFSRVTAIAISGFTRAQVMVDGAGRPTGPAILWNDIRAGETLADLRALLPETHPETREINAYHPLARLFWLARHEPERLSKAVAVLDPKDDLNLKLTGIISSDPVSLARLLAAGVVGPNGLSLVAASGLREDLVPPLQAPVSIMGKVRLGHPGALARLAGCPVITMANDTWASVVGLGAMRPGFGYNLTGTTEVFGLVSTSGATAEGLMRVDWGDGLTQLGGPSQCGGDTLAWLLGVLGCPDPTIFEALLATPRDPDPLLFLPYLQGERVPYWNPALRGAMIGLNRRHGPVDIAYAVMEGVAFLNRIVLDRAEAATQTTVCDIRFGGGGAANSIWCQIKADVLGRAISVVEAQEVGLLGAAIVAQTAIGRYPTLAAAQEALVRVRKTYLPDAIRSADYARLFALYREAEQALTPISARLADWRGNRVP
ncbi:MAG: carbohydrate kinase [Rhizobiales bacterium PAR1]|nr:MAG: carbohydrate kinase [Rhizobiales bacterium PAR1]